MFMLIRQRIIMVTMVAVALLAACGTPPAATTPAQPEATAAASSPLVPAVTAAPESATASAGTALPALSEAQLTVTPAPASTTEPASSGADTPNDTTQARLRVIHAVFKGPNVDIFVDGKLAMNGDRPQADIPAGNWSGVLYLQPGTYQVTVVPTGKGVAEALLGPLDVPIAAGHMYTVVMTGQLEDSRYKPLVIDETAEAMKLGAKPTDAVRILVNNVAGAAGLDVQIDGKIYNTNVPYGGFAAGIYPGANFPILFTVHGDPERVLIDLPVRNNWNPPGTVWLYGFAGQFPGREDVDWIAFEPPETSALNIVDFLQEFRGKQIVMGDKAASFDTFLQVIKRAGLSEMLAAGGPYLLLAPTDAAFAALPQDQREALMADPEALARMVRSHIVEGYYPWGNLSGTTWGVTDRTLTNMEGEKLALVDIRGRYTINTDPVNQLTTIMVANGSRVIMIDKVLLPAAQ